MSESIKCKIENNYVYFDGILDDSIRLLFMGSNLNKDYLYFFDFTKVCGVKFSGIRTIIDANNNGYRFMIINCEKSVLNYLYECGLNFYANIIGQPEEIDLSDYEHFGEGYEGESLASKDGDNIVKLYKGDRFKETVYREKNASMSIARTGLNIPISGKIYTNNGNFAIEYEKIKNKKSYSRALCDDYANIKKYAHDFAAIVKKLHNTECNTNTFMSAKTIYRKYVNDAQQLTSEEKNKMFQFIDSIEDRTTCLHGDLHIGNMIISNGESILIDLPDFCYGHPYFDLGVMYQISHYLSQETSERVYHITPKVFKEFWDYFIIEYLGTTDKDIIKKEEAYIIKFASLRVVFFLMTAGDKPEFRRTFTDSKIFE